MISNNELWKTIPGYDGFYEVSSEGRVRATRYWVPSKYGPGYYERGYYDLTPQDNGRGYLRVCLKGRYVQVSRLVAAAFCEREEGQDFVGHINRDPKDNRACNLVWRTRDEYVAQRRPRGKSKHHKERAPRKRVYYY